MTADPISLTIVSDFNADPLVGLLNNDSARPTVNAMAAPFGQVFQTLVDAQHPCWQTPCDVAVVWTRPESMIDTFAKALQFETIDTSAALSQVDQFAEAIASLAGRIGTVLVPTWVIPSSLAGYGLLDLHRNTGIRALLAEMNVRLMERLADVSGVFLLDTNRWLTGDVESFNPKLWYLAKVAFGQAVLHSAAQDIKSSLQALRGGTKKVIIVDLDDTLWGGIVGDAGWRNLTLGGHDPVGEALVDFQRMLKAYTNRGIMLAIVSKNEESVALEAIRSHPEMVLRTDDFAAWRINWNDKAQNTIELLSELNLGTESAVFLDDNPVERARIREAVPGVLVPELPGDKMLYCQTLSSLNCFSTPTLTDEDRQRSAMYQGRRAREAAKTEIGSLEQWLQTLGTEVIVAPLDAANQQRAAQLIAKTNQMNLTTRRLTESELVEWAGRDGRELWTFRVSDKFGDSGLTGVASLQPSGSTVQIVDFILSCRVMGRQVEQAIVHFLVQRARALGADSIVARYIPTDRNAPCLEFWRNSGFECGQQQCFSWRTSRPYPLPASIKFNQPTTVS